MTSKASDIVTAETKSYSARGCEYTFDQYEEGVCVVTCWGRDGEYRWSGNAGISHGDRVIDTVRRAKDQGEWDK